MKKISFSTILTVLLCAVLVIGAVCIGATRGWADESVELRTACMERHSTEGGDIRAQVDQCRAALSDYDRRLQSEWSGKIAMRFGVAPIADSLEPLHRQLLQNVPEKDVPDLQARLTDLLDDHVDTTLSLGKVFLTVILLLIIFGKRGKKGVSLGKLLAGFGLFKLWKRD